VVTTPYWSWDTGRALRELGATPMGLTHLEAQRRLAANGPNTLQAGEKETPARLFLRQFESPLVLILVMASLVALLMADWTEGSIILAIILGSTILGFAQEFHASRAVIALRQYEDSISVMRPPDLPAEDRKRRRGGATSR